MAKRSVRSRKTAPNREDRTPAGIAPCRQDIVFEPGVPYLTMSNTNNCCLHNSGKQSTPLKPYLCWLFRSINEKVNDYKGKGDKIYISTYKIARICGFKTSPRKPLESKVRRAIRELNRHLTAVELPLIGHYDSRKHGFPCPLALKDIEIEYPLSDKQIEIESVQESDEDE